MSSRLLDAHQLADAVRAGMLERDRATRALGMAVTAVGPGSATVEMAVRDDMLNGFDVCHGGLITSLADSAFAFACNSHNVLTLASSLSIDLLAPARGGDVLTACAVEVSLAGRIGVYDVVVSNQRGERIAVMRGRAYRKKGVPSVPLPGSTA
jgi:acyl-CoA thioesterase